MKTIGITILAGIGAALAMTHSATAQALYSVVPIYPPEGSGAYSSAGKGINDLSEIVGSYSRRDPESPGVNQIRSFFYSDSTGTVEAWPEAWSSLAESINNSGQIALYGGPLGNSFQSYRFTPGVGFEPLGSFGGPNSETEAINNRGQVTGFSENPDGRNQAFRYTDGVGMQNIGSPFTSSRGFAINDQGWVAGSGDGNAFLYRDDLGVIDLGPGRGYGINNAGMVVGQSFLPVGQEDAFIYKDGQVRILRQFGVHSTYLFDINDAEVAVGSGNVVIDNSVLVHAMLWTEGGGFVDLNSLIEQDSGWTLVTANAINELGQITGSATYNGLFIPYRLDPVPEPATWTVLALGAGMAWALRRRTRP